MIRTLSSLKYLKAGFSILAGISLCVFLFLLIDFILSKIKFRDKKLDAFEDIPTIREMNRMADAVKEYHKEMNSRTWIYSAAAGTLMFLLLAGAFFHEKIITAIGPELFIGCCVLMLVLMILFILRRANYRENACLYLAEYIDTLCHIYVDFHECIRLLLSPQYTTVVFGNVIGSIYRSVQEISDLDMLYAAGRIMHSDMLIRIADNVKLQAQGGRFYSKYYLNSFAEIKKEKNERRIVSTGQVNIIGFTVSFICLFCICFLF